MALDEAALERVQAFLLRESGGRPLTPQLRRSARIALTREAERLAPRDGRAAAITEADMTLGRITRLDGTVKPPKAVRKAAKAARAAREAEESLIRRKITEALAARGITETLTAGGVPQLPGAGMAPAQDNGEAGLYASMSAGRESPFWHLPATADGTAPEAPEPPKPLHDMTADEFRSYADHANSAYAKASGFGSPIWQD